MSVAQRRAREKENLRRAILDAARELFVTEDFQSVSIRKIADKIEYSPTAIYLYFKDKNEIFLHLMKEGNEKLADCLQACATDDLLETFRRASRAYFDFALSEPHYYKIMFLVEEEQMVQFCRLHLEEICGRSFGFLSQMMDQMQKQNIYQGKFSVAMLSHVVWAWMHGAAMLQLGQRLEWLPPEERSQYLDNVVESLIQFITLKK